MVVGWLLYIYGFTWKETLRNECEGSSRKLATRWTNSNRHTTSILDVLSVGKGGLSDFFLSFFFFTRAAVWKGRRTEKRRKQDRQNILTGDDSLTCRIQSVGFIDIGR